MTLAVTPKELERQNREAYAGWGYKAFAVDDPTFSLTLDSLAADWLALEISGGGYAPAEGVIEAGTYSTVTGYVASPSVVLPLTPTGVGFTYTHLGLLLSKRLVAALETVGRASGTATVVTTAPHGFEVGEVVTISDAAETAFNGAWTITAVPGWDSFEFALAGATITPTADTGSAVVARPEEYLTLVKTYPEAIVLSAGQDRSPVLTLVQDD